MSLFPNLTQNRHRSNLVGILSAASGRHHAAELHANLITSNLLADTYLHSLLVSLYASCSLLPSATAVLLSLPPTADAAGEDQHSISPAACTAVLSRLSRSPFSGDSLHLFSHLRRIGLLRHPNPFIFSAVLPACRLPSSGSQLHSLSLKHGVSGDLFVSSALADMYAKSADMDSAQQVFDEMQSRNLVSCNTLIVGYFHNSLFRKAIVAFRELLPLAKPDQTSFSCALSACAYSGELSSGQAVHSLAVKTLPDSLAFVKNSLINMYNRCGRVDDARKLFDKSSKRDAVAWNIMAVAAAEKEHFEEALGYFVSMRTLSVEPDEASFSTALHAAANLAELRLGTEIHCQAAKLGFAENRCISSSLITMYSKCGSLEDAQLAFAEAKHHLNVVSWTAMIAGFQQHGRADRVLQLFDEMLEAGLKPDSITFVCVLSACSHAGLIDKGFMYLASMSADHRKIPANEHYACVVDMLGRAGRLDEAKRFMDEMTVAPDASVWGALLGACRNRRNLELGIEVAYKLFEIEPHNPGNYVLLSNMYLLFGKRKEADEVRKLMGINGVKKETSCSWIAMRNATYVFTVNDRSHARTEEIKEMLVKMKKLVEEKGYVAETCFAVNDVEGYKEDGLWHHSERIALAFGLTSLGEGVPIRINKNLRTCGDCHTVMKLVSEIFRRKITLRDVKRFHHFEDGSCSCKDYW